MTASARTLPVLLLAIANGLLAGCGGSGGVRPMAPAPQAADPPSAVPAPSPQGAPCPAPVTADCIVDGPVPDMTGGRQSDHALIIRGSGGLTLIRESSQFDDSPVGDFRFDGGTSIEAGSLRVASNANLHSNVSVGTAGHMNLFGTTTGSVTNQGDVALWGNVVGDVINGGVLTPASSIDDDFIPAARVEGNFRQTPGGTLAAVMGATHGGYLYVAGRADLAGTLRLQAYADDWGPYPLPAAPLSLPVLHADGGVFGQFERWTSPGLFIAGNLRYLANDVYFDATAISAAQVMAAAKAGDATTLGSAGHFDVALDHAAGRQGISAAAGSPRQQQLLASAASIQRIRDYGQAIRTFDSLSGRGYAVAADALLRQAMLPSADLMARVGRVRAGSTPGAWSAQTATPAAGSGAFNDRRAGSDRWLDERTLLGSSFGWSDGSLRFDRSGGTAHDYAPQWDLHVQRIGRGDTYVFGDVGYGRHELQTQRRIDPGNGQHPVRARQHLDLLRLYFEAGRSFQLGKGRLTLFGAASHAMLRGAGFAEQGGTGFELVAQASGHQRTSLATGLRLGQDWQMRGGRWASIDLTAGYLRSLRVRDNARAAFAGAPDATFALGDMPHSRNAGWLQLNLGTGNEHWDWLMSYGRQTSDEALSLSARRRF